MTDEPKRTTARHDPFLKRLYRIGFPDAIRLFFPKVAAVIDWSRFSWSEKRSSSPTPVLVISSRIWSVKRPIYQDRR